MILFDSERIQRPKIFGLFSFLLFTFFNTYDKISFIKEMLVPIEKTSTMKEAKYNVKKISRNVR